MRQLTAVLFPIYFYIETKAGNKQTISFRRQRLDIDCMLPPSTQTSQQSTTSSSLNANLDDPYLIDMIKLADERITQLQTELDEIKQAKEILDNKLSNYKSQVGLLLIIYFRIFFLFYLLTLENNINRRKKKQITIMGFVFLFLFLNKLI